MFRRFEILSKFYIIKRPYYIDVYVFIFNNIAFDSYRMTVVKILHSYRVTVVKLLHSYRVTVVKLLHSYHVTVVMFLRITDL